MAKGWKIAVGVVTILAGLTYAATRAAKHVTEGLSYKFLGFDKKAISVTFAAKQLTLPANVEFTNKSPISVPIDRVQMILSYKQKGNYVQSGVLDQKNISIQPGTSIITFNPVIDLNALFKNILDTADTIYKNEGIDIKADITITIAGQSVSETVFHKIPVKL